MRGEPTTVPSSASGGTPARVDSPMGDWKSRLYLRTWEHKRRHDQVETLTRQIVGVERELKSLEASLSWRWTKPFRALGEWGRKLAECATAPKNEPADEFSWIDDLKIRKGLGVLADCSMTIRGKSSPGMRRVTTGIMRGFSQGGLIPVDILDGGMSGVSKHFDGEQTREKLAGVEAGVFLMLDASWDYREGVQKLAGICREAGLPVYALVHDTVPLDRPDLCLPQVVEKFSRWLEMVFAHCDGVVCVSETTTRQVQKHRIAMAPDREDLRIISWLPGSESLADLETAGELVPPDDYFLCVGTIEPRKNYGELLDVLSEMWATGNLDTRLVIFGERGWGVDDLMERLLNHPEWGRRLWWFEGGTDRHLRALYEHCKAFVLPSLDEGFSQPLSEAAAFGKPIVLSEIPIFRERVSSGGIFFELGKAESLAGALAAAATSGSLPTQVHSTDWESSAIALGELLSRPNP